jgi:hypothetical protein
LVISTPPGFCVIFVPAAKIHRQSLRQVKLIAETPFGSAGKFLERLDDQARLSQGGGFLPGQVDLLRADVDPSGFCTQHTPGERIFVSGALQMKQGPAAHLAHSGNDVVV